METVWVIFLEILFDDFDILPTDSEILFLESEKELDNELDIFWDTFPIDLDILPTDSEILFLEAVKKEEALLKISAVIALAWKLAVSKEFVKPEVIFFIDAAEKTDGSVVDRVVGRLAGADISLGADGDETKFLYASVKLGMLILLSAEETSAVIEVMEAKAELAEEKTKEKNIRTYALC